MGYSKDLRKRVLDFLASGGSKAEAARRYEVNRVTIWYWLKQPKDHKTKVCGPKDSVKFKREDLRQVLEECPDSLLSELAKQFGVSSSTIHLALKKNGCSADA